MNILRNCLMAASFLILAGKAVSADEASDLLFKVTFDQYQVRADRSGGKPDTISFDSPDLQLRMWKGVKDNKNAVTLSGNEVLDYEMKGNFDPRQGTVSLWVAPINWKPSEPFFRRFFTAHQPGFLFLVYKYHTPGQLLFYLQFKDKDKKTHIYSASAIAADDDWTPNKWHKLDVTWDSNGIKLYIDGIQPKEEKGKTPNSIPSKNFPKTLSLPEASPEGKIFLGAKVKNDKYNKRESISAFDELKIYNRPHTAEEIKKEYEKICPTRFGQKQEKPMVCIPEASELIVLDGKLNPAEWQDAVMLPIQKRFNLNASNRGSFSSAFLKRSSTHLLIGLKSCCKAFLTKQTQNDSGAISADDNFEIHLTSPAGKRYQFIINSAGKVFDSLNGNKKWNSNLQCKADAAADSWSAELMIPLKSLDPFTPENEWIANFHKTEYEGGFHGFSWSRTIGSFLNQEGFGKIRFTKNVPAVQIRGFKTLVSGHMNLKSCVYPSNAAAGLKFSAFYERENGFRAIFSDNLAKKTWQTILPNGNIRVNVSVKNGKDTIYSYEEYLYIRYPLEMTCKALPSKGIIELKLDLNGIPAELRKKLAAGIKLKAAIINRKNIEISAKEFTISGIHETIDLPLPRNIAAGQYTIVAEIPEAGVPIRKIRSFNVPDMTPFKFKVASDHSVPPPWSPVMKSGDRQYEVWGRQYVFRNGPFPKQIISQGRNMLTAGPVLTIEGIPVTWNGFTAGKQYQDAAFFSGTGSAAGLELKWSGELWFDGMYKVTWSMIPKNGKTRLKKMELAYQIPAEFGRYLMKMGREGVETWKNNRVEWVFDMRKSPYTQMTWTTGPHAGLVFWRLSDANWANRPGEKNLLLSRDRQKVDVRAKIISRQVDLTSPAEYTMVFQATPMRPLDGKFRSANLGLAKDDHATMRFWDEGGGYAFSEKIIPRVWTTPASHVPRFPEKYWKICRKTLPAEYQTKPDMYRLAYTLMGNLGSSEPEFDYFFESWATKPYSIWGYKFNGENHKLYRCCGSGIADLMMYRVEKLFQGDPNWIGGIYNDCGGGGAFCENPEHGCGGTDAFGKSFSSALALSIREYCLRQYKLTRKYKKKLMIHVSDTFVPFAHVFCDDILPGETFMWPLSKNPEYFYCEGVKPEFYQTVLNPEIVRVGVQLLPQLLRSCEFAPEMKKRFKEFKTTPSFTISMLTPVILHDFNTATYYAMPEPIVKWWGIKKELKLHKSKFHGYWYDNTFQSLSENLYASWYELPADSPYKRLVIIGNMGRKPQNAALKLNKKALGIGDGQIQFHDLWNNGKAIPEAELSTILIKGSSFLLLGIK